MSAGWLRWLVLSLVVANLGLVMLILHTPSDPAPLARDEAPPLDPGLPSLELVTELDNQSRPADTSEPVCYTIGPLASIEAQQRAQDRLRPFAEAIRTRQTIAERELGWWVYLPANSRSEAVGLSRDLASRGVEDYYVVTSGALENTVSVGLFSQIENARARRERIRALGFEAEIEARRESTPSYWVDYRIQPGERSPWRFIVRSNPDSQQRDIPCFDE